MFRVPTLPCALLTLLVGGGAFAEPLSLQQAEARLLERNREILAAASALQGARANVTMAGQAPNPVLAWSGVSFNPRVGLGAGTFADKRLDQTIALTQLVERGDKRELRGEVAGAQLRAADAGLADSRRQQRLALHQAYFGLKAAIERTRLTRETADLFNKAVDAGARRLKAGDIASVEVSRLKVEALRAENDAQSAAADETRARQTLQYVVGLPGNGEPIDPVDPWPEAMAMDGTESGLEQRPDVRAASARLAAADKARDLARSLTKRDVTVGVQAERYPPEPGVTWGLTVAFPLFWRYGYEGEAARSEADFTAARVDAERTVAQAGSERASARAALKAASDRVARLESTVLPEARRVGAAAEIAYNKGASGLTDLLDARRTLRAVELDAVNARADLAIARAAWLASTEWEFTQAEP